MLKACSDWKSISRIWECTGKTVNCTEDKINAEYRSINKPSKYARFMRGPFLEIWVSKNFHHIYRMRHVFVSAWQRLITLTYIRLLTKAPNWWRCTRKPPIHTIRRLASNFYEHRMVGDPPHALHKYLRRYNELVKAIRYSVAENPNKSYRLIAQFCL